MEGDQRKVSTETASQLMKAFGIKGAFSMWPDLTKLEPLHIGQVVGVRWDKEQERFTLDNGTPIVASDDSDRGIIDAEYSYRDPELTDPWEVWEDYDE